MTKVSKISKSKIMRQAWAIYKAGTKNFSICLKEAWKAVKATISAQTVTFWKLPKQTDAEVEITTRRVAELSAFDYTPKGDGSKSSTATFKFVDLDKYEKTHSVSASIISFYPYQLI